MAVQYEVQNILEHRLLAVGEVEFLIGWVDYGLDQCTWEPKSSLIAAEHALMKYTENYNKLSPIRAVDDFSNTENLAELMKTLKQKKPRELATTAEPAANADSEKQVESILDHRLLTGGDVEFLIKWQDCKMNKCTWEPADRLVGAQGALAKFTGNYNRRIKVRSLDDFTKKRNLGVLKKTLRNRKPEETVQAPEPVPNPPISENDKENQNNVDTEGLKELKVEPKVEPKEEPVEESEEEAQEYNEEEEVEEEEKPELDPRKKDDVLGNYLIMNFGSKKYKEKMGLTENKKVDTNLRRSIMQSELAKIQQEPLDTNCVFCGLQHHTTHCMQFQFVEDRIYCAKKNEICLRCAEPKIVDHTCTRVCRCAFCGKNTHNTAFCDMNTREIWYDLL